jgi:hypothetical protein
MKTVKVGLFTLVLGLAGATAMPAMISLRQYYDTTWSYAPSYGYYYVNYYYLPSPTYTTYSYHYCIYYPSQPSYIYYYNPVSQVFWGRYAIGSKGDKRYSILAQKDRKKDLKDIPESAFPPAAAMPSIPGAEDGVAMEPPPENVPRGTK